MRLVKDYQPLAAVAKANGWDITNDPSGHLRWQSPHGDTVHTPATPSDWRGLANVRRQLRHAGLDIPKKNHKARPKRQERPMTQRLASVEWPKHNGNPTGNPDPRDELADAARQLHASLLVSAREDGVPEQQDGVDGYLWEGSLLPRFRELWPTMAEAAARSTSLQMVRRLKDANDLQCLTKGRGAGPKGGVTPSLYWINATFVEVAPYARRAPRQTKPKPKPVVRGPVVIPTEHPLAAKACGDTAVDDADQLAGLARLIPKLQAERDTLDKRLSDAKEQFRVLTERVLDVR